MYKTTFSASGSWFNEKKVPLRKVIGNNTKLLKVLISWCDFAKNATSTPKKAKRKQERTRTSIKSGLIINVGEITKPTSNIALELIKPLTTPIKVFPMASEKRLIGDIKHSSKDL